MIRFGLIGAGAIAHAFSTACIGCGFTLEAVASRSLEKAISFQTQYGYHKAYGDYESLYLDDEVDAIYVATPHGLHYEQMLDILKYKKHILCEKSFTLNANQAKHIYDLAKAQGVFVMEAMWTRFLPITHDVLNVMNSGLIGIPHAMRVDFAFATPLSESSRLYNKTLGGGALLDVGIYPITYANLCFGIPDMIQAKASMTETGVDGSIDIEYHYKNHQATLHASVVVEGGKDAYIYGDKGFIKVPSFWAAEEAFVYDLDHQLIKHISIPHRVNGYEYEIEAFMKAILDESYRTPYMNVEDSLDILKQMDHIRQQIGLTYPNEDLK